MNASKKGIRGGARPGAGRKPLNEATRVTVAARVTPETRDRLYELVRESGQTIGDVIKDAIEALEALYR